MPLCQLISQLRRSCSSDMVVLGVVATGLLISVASLWIYVKWKKTKHLPPGPNGFGLLIRHYLFGQPLHTALSNLRTKYGEIVSFMYWAKPVIVLNNTYAIEQALRSRGFTFTGRNGPVYMRGLKYRQTSQAINITEGDQWKFLHSVLSKALQCCDENLNLLVEQNLRFNPETKLELREFCEQYCLRVYSQLFFGNVLSSHPYHKDDLRHIFSVEHSLVWHYLHDNNMFSNSMRTYRNKLNNVDGLIWTVLQRMKMRPSDSDSSDGETACKNLLEKLIEQNLSDEEITANVTTLLVYAVMSSAIQLHWCLLFWLNQQNLVQNKETNLEFCRMFIQEVQRLRPILPLGYPRRVLHSTQLFGFTIPRDALILMNIHEVHSDATQWPQVDMFKPHRFQSKEISCDAPWLPFGAGRRCCTGADLSLNFLSLTMLAIIRNWTVESADSSSLCLKGRSQGLLQIPKNANVIFHKTLDRDHSHVE